MLGLAAVFVLLLVGAAVVMVRQAEAVGRSQTRAQLQDTTRALAQVVDAKLEGYRQLLVTLAASQAMERGDYRELDRQARAALSDSEAWIVIADRDGTQRVNTRLPPGAALPRAALDPRLLADLDSGRPRYCNLVQGLLERQLLCVDVPLMRNGQAVAMLSVMIKPRLLQRIIDAQAVPTGRFATILDRHGVVVWRNAHPERFVGKMATFDVQRRLRVANEGLLTSRSLDGVPTEMAFSTSKVSGWTFIIAIPRQELAMASSQAVRNGGLVAVALLVAVLAVAAWAAKVVTDDVRKLAAAADRIRNGDPPKFEPSRFDEFADVGSLLASAIAERDESAERFDLAQDVGGIGSWDWDSLKDEGHVSESYKRMHGLQDLEGPLRFAQVLATVHPDDREGYLERLALAKTRPEPSTNSYRAVHPDGSITWVAAKGRPIFDDAGRVIRSVGIVRDATADHEAAVAMEGLNALLERQVEERTAERDRLWNLARDPFVVADEKGVWLAASPAWTTLLGYPLESFLGRTSEWIEHPEDIARTRAEDRRLAGGEITERFENRFRAHDGTYRWLSWTAVPEGGRFYSVARDITEEKARAEDLRKAESALRQAQKMESIGQITGGVAHDFNNLLTPIMATLDRLQRISGLAAREQRLVSNALEAVERARTLVQRLLAFARRQPLRSQAIDIVASLRNMEPLLQTTLGPTIGLTWDLRPDLPAVSADANQIEMAILNLTVNARDATPSGGGMTITARSQDVAADEVSGLTAGRYVVVSLADTGVGMPPSVVERAFEPFFSTKGLGRGTGLGLSMVHGLLAQLGGAVTIDSKLGQGTTVSLWLKPAEEPAALAVQAPTIVRQFAGRVLLVDDEDLVRAGARQMLVDLGFTVDEASLASTALARLETEPFDVLITDHLMEGMSGADLARRALDLKPDLKILIISGYADVDDIAPDLARLAKPFRLTELASALACLNIMPHEGQAQF